MACPAYLGERAARLAWSGRRPGRRWPCAARRTAGQLRL